MSFKSSLFKNFDVLYFNFVNIFRNFIQRLIDSFKNCKEMNWRLNNVKLVTTLRFDIINNTYLSNILTLIKIN